jgi:endonuclease YncB( thermonuclease family)
MPYLLALILLVIAASASAETARVIDGDSLEVAGEDIRLIGIDAPEGRQLCQRDGLEWACGDDATAALRELVAGAEVRCHVWAMTAGARAWEFALAMQSS